MGGRFGPVDAVKDATDVKTAPQFNGADLKRVPILNAYVHDISMDWLVENLTEGLLLTLHVDMVMKLQSDRDFLAILDEFDVVTCDSQIMAFCTKFLGTPVRERVSGSDFFPKFYMHHKDNPAMSVFILGGRPEVAELARKRINQKVGREFVVGSYSPPMGFEEDEAELAKVFEAVNASGAPAVMVCLGGGRQEKFVVGQHRNMPGAKLWLPLGGTVDYEAGTLPRPAPWVTNVGLEWFYRLIKDPRGRFRRYVLEDPPFLWGVLKQKLGLYRDPLN